MEPNPRLTSAMFIKCGWNELAFIRNTGAMMGMSFGLLQMVLWQVRRAEMVGWWFCLDGGFGLRWWWGREMVGSWRRNEIVGVGLLGVAWAGSA